MVWMALKALWAGVASFVEMVPLRYWLWIGGIALVLGYHFYTLHEAHTNGYTEGFETSNQQCETREKAAKADYEKHAKEAEEAKKTQEQEQATALAAIGVEHAKEMKDAQDTRDRDVALARSGALKLRVAGMCPRAPAGDPAPQVAATAAGRDDAAGGELPPDVTGRLFSLADAADAVAKQLSACQAVIATYLKGQS